MSKTTPKIKTFNKILVANRGEIAIRVLRAAAELNIRTVAIYTYEDRYSLHRFKADESYQIGDEEEPLKPYLDIDTIVCIAKRENVDAIHPGYGFLSENADFARKCRENNITFIGPTPEVMEMLGDKKKCKDLARQTSVPIIEDSRIELDTLEKAESEAERIGFPIMVKAVSGGGGRGMRVVKSKAELKNLFFEAKNEALKAFGNDQVYLEKYVDNPKHIEVQLLGDNYGNIVHLYERDCSVQRRFQKVVEVAPSIGLSDKVREDLYAYALEIGRKSGYSNAGTVEFLLDKDHNIYFIEVNTRIQVEHTITEEITLVDLVRTQILIAEGYPLSDKRILLQDQSKIPIRGFAVQCRITTEDPENNFKPDYGRLFEYRNGTGFGIRLDEGNAYSGVSISPFYDSMLVKVTARGRTLRGAARRLHRSLREFRIRGVTTNLGFLQQLISDKKFLDGEATVNFIAEHPELLQAKLPLDRATKKLYFIADTIVNGNEQVKGKIDLSKNAKFRMPKVASFLDAPVLPKGTVDLLKQLGREKFANHILNEKKVLFTDTTFRDAHQSLLATRMRSYDMLKVAESYAHNAPQLFSVEMWGGATFDVCMRFLNECPWDRLKNMKAKLPNILFQMLIRSSNAVGYTAYPDNLIKEFIIKSAEQGIDVFRIFDSLNWTKSMKQSIDTVVKETNSLAEVAICYTGNIIDPSRTKYTLQYYVDLAKELQDMGAHILAIKDMAGLLTPYSAQALVTALKEKLSIPIHLHTHDTSSVQSATYLKAIESGVDIVDCSFASFSGLTSQPNLNSICYALKNTERESDLDMEKLNGISNYWEIVREYYYPFETDLRAGTAQVYEHEIPGGQYSNLRAQAASLGLEDRIEDIKKNYALANEMLGDIVKVTPSSKVVGDLALFITSNNLTKEDIFERGDTLSFPESLKGLLMGNLGQPAGGWPKDLQKIILKAQKPFTSLPNEHLESINFEEEYKAFKKEFNSEELSELDFLSYKLYPKVFEEYFDRHKTYGNVSILPTPVFYYGLQRGEEVIVEIDKGKNAIISYEYASEPDARGFRDVSFKLNGKVRRLLVKDRAVESKVAINVKANPNAPHEIGCPLQGKISKIFVKEGDQVEKNSPLFVLEAMKMETTINAPFDSVITSVLLKENSTVEQDDLVVILQIDQ